VRTLESAGDEIATVALYDGRDDLDGTRHFARTRSSRRPPG
jgi:hypothetical protein